MRIIVTFNDFGQNIESSNVYTHHKFFLWVDLCFLYKNILFKTHLRSAELKNNILEHTRASAILLMTSLVIQ